MLSSSLHIIGSFMSHLQSVPQLLGRWALRNPETFIWIQGRCYNVLSNTIKFGLLVFKISPLGPRFFNRRFIFFKFRNKRVIFNCIPNSFVKRYNKDFHSNFPDLIIQTTEQRCFRIKLQYFSSTKLFISIVRIYGLKREGVRII